MTRAYTVLAIAVVASMAFCAGCGDNKMRERIAALDDPTLQDIQSDYPADSKAGVLIAQELDRRNLSPTGPPQPKTRSMAEPRKDAKEPGSVLAEEREHPAYNQPTGANVVDQQHPSTRRDREISPPVMFTVGEGQTLSEPVESHDCTFTPSEGHIIFSWRVQFTDEARALSVEDFCKLDVAQKAKEWTKVDEGNYGNKSVAFGDIRLRLKDGSMIPCAVLPLDEKHGGPSLKWSGEQDGWLMYTGHIRVLASAQRSAKPVALVWGGKYEVAIARE